MELGCCKALCNNSFGQCLVMTSAFVQGEDVASALPLLERREGEESSAGPPVAEPTELPTTSTEHPEGKGDTEKATGGYAG
eukprot:g21676.t1